MSDLNGSPSSSGDSDQFARLLRNLAPSAGKLRHDRVVFEAGRVKGRRQIHFWVGTTAMLACITVCLTFWVVILDLEQRPQQAFPFQQSASPTLVPVVIPMPYHLEPTPTPDQVARQQDDDRVKRAWDIRRQMLEKGIEELPELVSTPNLPNAIANDLHDLLPEDGPPRPQIPGTIYLIPR